MQDVASEAGARPGVKGRLVRVSEGLGLRTVGSVRVGLAIGSMSRKRLIEELRCDRQADRQAARVYGIVQQHSTCVHCMPEVKRYRSISAIGQPSLLL